MTDDITSMPLDPVVLRRAAIALLAGRGNLDYCQVMSLRRCCIWAGEEALAAALFDKAMAMEPTDNEMLAAGYGV